MSSKKLTKFPDATVLAVRDGRILPEDDVADEACVEVVTVVASMPESGSIRIKE